MSVTGIPVRWQILDGDSPYRSPVHRLWWRGRPPVLRNVYLTVCNVVVPAGAWSGRDVDARAPKCPTCWKEEDPDQETS